MKVYLVMKGLDQEGAWPLAVFSTRERAEAFKQQEQEDDQSVWYWYRVDEMEVQE